MALFKNGDEQADSTWSISNWVTPATSPVVGSSGSVDVGGHQYVVTDTINGVESAGVRSSTVTISSSAKQVTVPLSTLTVPPGSTLRTVYRSAQSAPTGTLFKVATSTPTAGVYSDYVDNSSDASIAANPSPPASSAITIVQITPFDSSAVYTFSYQSLVTFNAFDKLGFATNTVLAKSLGVGTSIGSTDFVENTDYGFAWAGTGTISSSGTAITGSTTPVSTKFSSEIVAGDVIVIAGQPLVVSFVTDDTHLTLATAPANTVLAGTAFNILDSQLKWLTPQAASIAGSVVGPFDFTVGGGLPKTLIFTVDGGAPVTVTFLGTDTGFTGTPSAVTGTNVINKINTVSTSLLGANVASLVGGAVVLTSLSSGANSFLSIGNGTANGVLGFQNEALDQGAGKTPAQGQEYFISYTAARPATDFNNPVLTTSYQDYISKVGPVSSTNALALGGQFIYDQDPSFVYYIQVQNTGTGLAAQDIDYATAIKAAELNPDLTDVVVLGHPTTVGGGTKALVRQRLKEHVTNQSSLLSKAERLGWFGMSVGSTVGDAETPGTFIFAATQELQVSADSPGRGRFVLVGPDFVQKTFRFPDGSVKQLKLDSTYLAAAMAALQVALPSPASGLLRVPVNGLDAVNDFGVSGRNLAAANGVTIIGLRGASIVIFDPVTTDTSSAEFREINVMAQKDHLAKRVRRDADDALVGLVPDDLAQFIIEIKTQVGQSINDEISDGAVGPFQDSNGTPRRIDLTQDVIASQRVSDPTTYDFNYSFFPKFIAKRLFGVYRAQVPSGI
jgi:hypothetical protein